RPVSLPPTFRVVDRRIADGGARTFEGPDAPCVGGDAVVDREAEIRGCFDARPDELDEISVRKQRREVTGRSRPVARPNRADPQADHGKIERIGVIPAGGFPERLADTIRPVRPDGNGRVELSKRTRLETAVLARYD